MSSLKQIIEQAERFRLQGRLADAEAIYQQVIQQYPESHSAYHGLGLVALDSGNITLAIDFINRAITYDDTNASYYSNLGELCRRSGRLEAAVASGNRAVELAPKEAGYYYNLALAYADNQQPDEAIRCYRKTIKLQPRHGLAYNNLGAIEGKKGNVIEAEKCYAKAVAINSQHFEAQTNLGAIYVEKGQIEKACACFEAAIRANPYFIDAHYNLSSLKTYRRDDPHVNLLMTMASTIMQYSIDAQIRFCFAFAKALEDIGEYAQSFTAYSEGNRLQRSLMEYSPAYEIKVMQQVLSTFTKDFIDQHQDHGFKDATPIFIVGMPRSGSTLLEQILDSHPQVHGIGEHKLLGTIMNEYIVGEEGFKNFSSKTQEEISHIGKEYVDQLRTFAKQNKTFLNKSKSNQVFIANKMLSNFFYIGFIRTILPNAKIIHTMRNPMDSCFSCFGRFFEKTMNFTYSLKEIGEYYVRYIQLMEHWHKVVPNTYLLDVSYENLVTNFESEARRILEFLELPWDDNCLSFHKNKRLVETASIAQVQKPLYQSSANRTTRFLPYLGELKNIVGEDYNQKVKLWCQ
jgi:tetratricopeptide (TPR) repeat protein